MRSVRRAIAKIVLFLLVVPLLLLAACTAPWSTPNERIRDAASKWTEECDRIMAKGTQLGLLPPSCNHELFGEASVRLLDGEQRGGAHTPTVPDTGRQASTDNGRIINIIQ